MSAFSSLRGVPRFPFRANGYRWGRGQRGTPPALGVLQRQVSDSAVSGWLNNALHWMYGTSWGVPFAIAAGSHADGSLLRHGLGLGMGVWAASRAEMAAMKIAPPPWQDPPKMLAMDIGFHLVYGLAGAATFRALR
jgi:hypothetical protein